MRCVIILLFFRAHEGLGCYREEQGGYHLVEGQGKLILLQVRKSWRRKKNEKDLRFCDEMMECWDFKLSREDRPRERL